MIFTAIVFSKNILHWYLKFVLRNLHKQGTWGFAKRQKKILSWYSDQQSILMKLSKVIRKF